jgi:hypothetical protein
MAAVLRSLTLLGLTGASAALCLQEVLGTWLSGFVLSNTLSIQNRHHLIIGMVIGAVAAMLVGVVVWWSDERRLRRLAHLLTPGILLGLLPPVTMVTWTNHLNLASRSPLSSCWVSGCCAWRSSRPGSRRSRTARMVRGGCRGPRPRSGRVSPPAGRCYSGRASGAGCRSRS